MKNLYLTLLTAVAICLLPSCKTSRPLTYFKNAPLEQAIPTGDYSIKIQPADELLISVTSQDLTATSQYNMPLINPATNENLLLSTQPRQQTYVVNTKGNIDFPTIGEIHVAGLTLEQLKDELTQLISKEVENPIVKVELVNFFVNVAGEVKEPGRVPVTTTRFSILDALTAAGDMTPYGKRNNVLIIREEDGQRTSMRLNMNDPATLSSPYFYLRQNDYVYVEPSEVRKDNADYNQNNTFKLQVVSTLVSTLSVITSLVIALTR